MHICVSARTLQLQIKHCNRKSVSKGRTNLSIDILHERRVDLWAASSKLVLHFLHLRTQEVLQEFCMGVGLPPLLHTGTWSSDTCTATSLLHAGLQAMYVQHNGNQAVGVKHVQSKTGIPHESRLALL